MPALIFPAAPVPGLPVIGRDGRFAVRRIFCVGRNYAEHAREMGNEVDREAPFYFTKSAHAVLQSGSDMPYPPGTADLHHEIELVVALGPGAQVFGHAVGLDMTRRDLQAVAKDKRRPWAVAKDFDASAIIGPITEGASASGAIWLKVNGELRQSGDVADMIHGVPALIAHLGGLYALEAGDLIMTGTPAGVGPVVRGDRLEGGVDGLAGVTTQIV